MLLVPVKLNCVIFKKRKTVFTILQKMRQIRKKILTNQSYIY